MKRAMLPTPWNPRPVAVALAFGALASGCLPSEPKATLRDRHLVVQERSNQPIFSVDAESGKTLAVMPPERFAGASVAYGDTAFFFGAGGLVARDLDTGEAKWRLFISIPDGYPIAANRSSVLVPQFVNTRLLGRGDVVTGAKSSVRGQMSWVALDLDKGSRLYELRADFFAPLATNDDVAVTFENKDLVAYSVADGKERWRSSVAVRPPISLEGGRVFARSGDKLAVFAASSGALRKTIDLGGDDAFSCAKERFAARGNVVAWIESHVLHVADLESGRESYKKEGADRVAISSGAVVVARASELVAYDPVTGAVRWKLALGDAPSSLSADEQAIVARIEGSQAVVVDAESGKRRFVFDTKKAPRG